MAPVLKTDPFARARQFMKDAGASRVDPATVRETLDRGEMLRASRRPIKLKMRGNSDKITVRRTAGLYLPAKYVEARRDRKSITLALYSGRHELIAPDYDRQILPAGVDRVTFVCQEADWGRIDGYSVFVQNIGEYFSLHEPKYIRKDDRFDLKFPSKKSVQV